MINYDKDIKGSFEILSDTTQNSVMEIVANFHIRDEIKHSDGSMGTIKITNKEMNDCLAFIMRNLYQMLMKEGKWK